MPSLIYLHGFLSSPDSVKARETRSWLETHRPDIQYHCPFLSSYPGQAREALERLMEDLKGEQTGLVGSSLGGFWASFLAERYQLRAVLVNPAVRPQDRFAEFVGQPLKNYHSADEYRLGPDDLRALVAADVPVSPVSGRYWVLLQTGDETLDYRLAEEKYRGSKMLVEEGGNHGFEGFARWLPDIVEFLFD